MKYLILYYDNLLNKYNYITFCDSEGAYNFRLKLLNEGKRVIYVYKLYGRC